MKKFIAVKGFQYCIQDNGQEGQPMVFIHGLPTCKELFSLLSPCFDSDFRTISVDLLNFGESEKVNRHMEHRERARNLYLLFRELKLEDIILVSHDMGSSLAMELMAVCQEKIASLIMMSPPVYPDYKEPPVVKIVRSALLGLPLLIIAKKRMLKHAIEKGLADKQQYDRILRESLEKAFSGWEGNKALLKDLRWGRPCRVFSSYPSIMKTIGQQVLIVQGLKDPYIPVSHARRLQEDIPHAELVLLEEGSHFLPLDNAEEIYSAIRNFLQKLA